MKENKLIGACDLHTHSYYSDGTVSPRFLAEQSARLGLSSVALTDHNTTAGLAEFAAAAKECGINGICGVEFSTDYGERELHIIGLFIEQKHYSDINLRLEALHRRKDESNINLIQDLKKLGMNIDYDSVASTAKGHINRAHIAAVLFERGYADSVKDAFTRYLHPSVGIYKPPKRLDAFETIEYIESIGAVSVLAHPALSFDNMEDVEAFIKEAKPHGLSAIETRYSTYSDTQELALISLCEKYELLESGGSDYHAEKKPDISIGCGRGNLLVPGQIATALWEKAQKNRNY